MNSPKNLWDRIDAIIAKRGLELNDLADGTGISYKTVIGWRYRGRYPKVEELISISSFLNVSMDYLATGKESEPFSDEAIAVEYSEKLKSIVRQLEKDDTLLEIISATIESVERTKNIS